MGLYKRPKSCIVWRETRRVVYKHVRVQGRTEAAGRWSLEERYLIGKRRKQIGCMMFSAKLVLREEYSNRLAWNAESSESFSVRSLYNPYEINFEQHF